MESRADRRGRQPDAPVKEVQVWQLIHHLMLKMIFEGWSFQQVLSLNTKNMAEIRDIRS